MSQPVVYLDNMLDHELASKLTTIIVKHQVICCNVKNDQIEPVRTDVSAVESQFLLPQGTVTDDRILASHHVFPLNASTNDGQLNSNLSGYLLNA